MKWALLVSGPSGKPYGLLLSYLGALEVIVHIREFYNVLPTRMQYLRPLVRGMTPQLALPYYPK